MPSPNFEFFSALRENLNVYERRRSNGAGRIFLNSLSAKVRRNPNQTQKIDSRAGSSTKSYRKSLPSSQRNTPMFHKPRYIRAVRENVRPTLKRGSPFTQAPGGCGRTLEERRSAEFRLPLRKGFGRALLACAGTTCPRLQCMAHSGREPADGPQARGAAGQQHVAFVPELRSMECALPSAALADEYAFLLSHNRTLNSIPSGERPA
jgi:hypothetical protein